MRTKADRAGVAPDRRGSMPRNDHDDEIDKAADHKLTRMGDVPFYLMVLIIAVLFVAIYGGAAYLIVRRLSDAIWWRFVF